MLLRVLPRRSSGQTVDRLVSPTAIHEKRQSSDVEEETSRAIDLSDPSPLPLDSAIPSRGLGFTSPDARRQSRSLQQIPSWRRRRWCSPSSPSQGATAPRKASPPAHVYATLSATSDSFSLPLSSIDAGMELTDRCLVLSHLNEWPHPCARNWDCGSHWQGFHFRNLMSLL